MLRLSILLIIFALANFDNPCKYKHDLSIYMSPYSNSLYIEGRNIIINSVN